MKVVNDLLGYKNIKIVQDTKYFMFSLDSVLLANFVDIKKDGEKILDIGTGNLPIPLILSKKTDSEIHAIEIQKEIFEIGVETLKINNLSNRINLINDDVNNINIYFKPESFDVITCNPPYFKVFDLSKKNDDVVKSVARHEIKLDLETLITISFNLLKNNGKLALVHRTERLTEILCLMNKYRIEPKKIMFVFPKNDKQSNLVLIQGIKNGNPGLKSVDKIVAHNNDGSYTDDVLKYFK